MSESITKTSTLPNGNQHTGLDPAYRTPAEGVGIPMMHVDFSDPDGAQTLSILKPDYPRTFGTTSDTRQAGVLLRNMVAPVLMPGFLNMLHALHVDEGSTAEDRSLNRAAALIGPPGLGKTEAGHVLARAFGMQMHLIPCGGKVIDNLIEYTTAAHSITESEIEKKITERYNSGELSSTSKNLIEQACGAYIASDESGNKKLDLYRELPDEEKQDAREVFDTLRGVAEAEGIAPKGGQLMTKVSGPLFEALKAAKNSGHPQLILLDEFTRRSDASGGNPMLYEVLVGTRKDSITITAGSEKLELSNADLRKNGTFVIFTGNTRDPNDRSIQAFPDALLSRVEVINLEHAAARDYTHRIQQILTGLPISTHYQAQKSRWEETGGSTAFQQSLKTAQRLGLETHEMKDIPGEHDSYIANWKKVMQGTEQFANFMFDLELMSNTDSGIYANGSDFSRKLKGEITKIESNPNHPANNMHFDLRPAQKWLEEARAYKDAVNKPGENQKYTPGNGFPQETIGNHLVGKIYEKINQLFPQTRADNATIREYIKTLYAKHGIYLPDKEITASNQGAKETASKGVDVQGLSNVQSIAQLLNTPREISQDATIRAWQEMLVEVIARKYPEEVTQEALGQPDQVLSYAAVANLMGMQPKLVATLREQAHEGSVAVVPTVQILTPVNGGKYGVQLGLEEAIDPYSIGEMQKEYPDMATQVIEAYQAETSGSGRDGKNAPDFLSFMVTLAMPDVAPALLPDLLKTDTFIKMRPEKEAIGELPIRIGSGKENPLHVNVTPLQVGMVNGEPDIVHLLVKFKDVEDGSRNTDGSPKQEFDSAFIIGNHADVPEKLRQMLQGQGITYICQRDDDAAQKIAAAFENLGNHAQNHLRQQLEAEKEAAEEKGEVATPNPLSAITNPTEMVISAEMMKMDPTRKFCEEHGITKVQMIEPSEKIIVEEEVNGRKQQVEKESATGKYCKEHGIVQLVEIPQNGSQFIAEALHKGEMKPVNVKMALAGDIQKILPEANQETWRDFVASTQQQSAKSM